ncbi:flagella cluster protein [Halorussus limi]|uniref:Flagella cluster protein n=1 Tax=Halorussus limi TaxID=2938695 RepID=A0A8U0HVX7_9EURY|nr:flagella cluster protein [Halorussus limi]UPV74774.1 flagella cluster protein [Halorussus limi]
MTAERFDVHDHRHALKLHKDSGQTQLWENKKALDCPACGDPFAELLISEKRHNSFNRPDGRFCAVREEDRLLVFTH